ncbi:MAG: hypothetical protein ACR2LT_09840 [Pyrinomonadaceae bacterium]
MNEKPDSDEKSAVEIGTENNDGSLWKRIAGFAVALFIAFLFGLIPMWLSASETVRQRNAAQENLRLSLLQNRLATAAINARRGEYEPARIAASDFYTDLRAEVDRPESAFTARQIKAAQPILQQRDEIITLLAKNDAATGDRLADLYLNYLQAINSPAQKAAENIF